ncbi:hypothetical protein FD755_024978, partial [Muntiacus reevesi]
HRALSPPGSPLPPAPSSPALSPSPLPVLFHCALSPPCSPLPILLHRTLSPLRPPHLPHSRRSLPLPLPTLLLHRLLHPPPPPLAPLPVLHFTRSSFRVSTVHLVIVSPVVELGANDVYAFLSIRDVSKWSERTRKPLEALYGFDYFARTCEKWVDGIEQFKHLPDGSICRDLLPLVQCPTLIMHGEKDPLVPRFHADFLHRHVRGSRFHLMPEGKHNLHLRFADEFNKLAEDFLR